LTSASATSSKVQLLAPPSEQTAARSGANQRQNANSMMLNKVMISSEPITATSYDEGAQL
tara:strand:- start:473 stop:652 length:180 start_codon:yes stop_codon:yes gene_type:complete